MSNGATRVVGEEQRRREMDEDKREVIRRMEDVGGELSLHSLSASSSWEDIQDYITNRIARLEDIVPLVDE